MVDILKRVETRAVDAPDVLRQLGEGLRSDAAMALCCEASVVETKFTLAAADARAVADEIARLQGLDAAAVELVQVAEPAAWREDIGWLQAFSLAVCLVLVLPVALSILGWLQ